MGLMDGKFFERDLFFLRKFFPYLRNIYHYNKGVNFQSLPEKKYPEASLKVKKASEVLDNLKAATFDDSQKVSFPKKIWMYWNSSIEEAPDVVKTSIKTWSLMNPDYELILLTDNNIEEVLGFDFNSVFYMATVNLGYAMKADILRLYLLSKFGGVWVDTTTFCIKPMASWLPNCLDNTGVFTFRHQHNRTRPIEAWFIASEKGNFIIRNVLQMFLEHIFKDRKNCLYITNRIKVMGLSDKSEEMFAKDVVLKAESHNFMPYFSIGYFFNEAFRDEKGRRVWEELQGKTNFHAINNSSMETVKESFVSKQTYKGDYEQSDIYLTRKKWVLEQI